MLSVFESVCKAKNWKFSDSSTNVPLPNDRHQILYFEKHQEAGETMMRVYSIIGGSDILDEQRMLTALNINYRLQYGALAVREDKLILTENFLLRDADEDEVAQTLVYIANQADQYEKLIYGIDRN